MLNNASAKIALHENKISNLCRHLHLCAYQGTVQNSQECSYHEYLPVEHE